VKGPFDPSTKYASSEHACAQISLSIEFPFHRNSVAEYFGLGSTSLSG
jgi:hypothetical protein